MEMRRPFQFLCVLAIFVLAGVAGYHGINGVLDGTVAFPKKTESLLIFREASPKTYWACVAFWLASCVGFVWLAIVNLLEMSRPPKDYIE